MTPTPTFVARSRAAADGAPSTDAARTGNLMALVLDHARTDPTRPALVVPTQWNDHDVIAHEQLSYGALARRVSAWQRRLRAEGLGEGHRVLLLAPVSIDFYAGAIAAIASGMTVVLVDRGMSLGRIRGAIDRAGPDAVVVSHEAKRWTRVVPELRRIERRVPAELDATELTHADALPELVDRTHEDEAIISFTSGSTGRPKGADRTHGILWAQHESLQRAFPCRDHDVDMTAWPVLVLHDLLVGIPSVVPPVRRGALDAVPPEATLAFAIEHEVTLLNGPPAFLQPIIERARRRAAVPALRRIVTGGGPVYPDLCREVLSTFPHVEGHVLYGGTEAEPIAHCRMEELIVADANGTWSAGAGLLVGPPVPDIDLRVVDLLERPSTPASIDDVAVAPGDWGEIVVRGDHVLARWFRDPHADEATHIRTVDGAWLRTGDVGRLDEAGRVWLGGRTADLIRRDGEMIHPYEVEPMIDRLHGVRRAALMAAPGGGVELFLDASGDAATVAEVQRTLADAGHGAVRVRWPVAIPVDGRHNSKVDRPKLRARRRQIVAAAAARRVVFALRHRRERRVPPPVPDAPTRQRPEQQGGTR